tara:strand:+ start:1402 stop:3255 length:1854 start_codon:yes stop_codon:yes gene_type:complete
MARRSGIRSTAAKSMVRLKGHEYDRNVKASLQQINQQAFEDREKRSDSRYAAAAQFVTTLDKMSAAKEQDVKAEKGVTAMQQETGESVSYKKSTLKGWMKGENKFRDIGKETFSFGDTEYSKADMIAYDKTMKKNKWENVDVDNSEAPVIKATESQDGMKAWSYESQKATDKEARAIAKKQKAFEDRPWESDPDRFASPDQQRASLKKERNEEKAIKKQEKADLKEQANILKDKEGSMFSKFREKFKIEYGEDKDIDKMNKHRHYNKTSNVDSDDGDIEPASTDEIVAKYTEGSDDDFANAVDMTEGSDNPTKAQLDVDSDMSDANASKNISKSPQPTSVDDAIAQGNKKDYWGDHKGPDFMKGKSPKEYLGGLFGGGEEAGSDDASKTMTKDEFIKSDKYKAKSSQRDNPTYQTHKFNQYLKKNDPEAFSKVVEQARESGQLKTKEPAVDTKIDVKPIPDNKSIGKSLDTIQKDAQEYSTAQGYVEKNQKFDDNVTAKSPDLYVGQSSRDKKSGMSMYSLYEGDKMIMEDAFQVKIDPTTGGDTRNIGNMNPMIKGWKGLYDVPGMSNIGSNNRKPISYGDNTDDNQFKTDSLVSAANLPLGKSDEEKKHYAILNQ